MSGDIGFYILGFDSNDRLWSAHDSEGWRILTARSLKEMVSKCEKRGLKMNGATFRALEEINRRIVITEAAVRHLKETFPEHIHSPDDRKGPLGFQVDSG